MTFKPQQLTPYHSARHYFGAEQRRHRAAARLSLVQLAEILNSSKSTLARVETAELMPPPDLPAQLDAGSWTSRRRRRSLKPTSTPVCPARIDSARPSPPLRWAIIDEVVLRRPFGSSECMFKQLALLLEQVDTPDSKVQVMPFRAGPYFLMGGVLNLLTLSNGSPMAYEEGIEVSHLYEDRESAKKWRRHYDVLRANALSPAASAELIRQRRDHRGLPRRRPRTRQQEPPPPRPRAPRPSPDLGHVRQLPEGVRQNERTGRVA